MSHIYDALRKASQQQPPAGSAVPADTDAGGSPNGLTPRAAVGGKLLGAPAIGFLQQLDSVRASLEALLPPPMHRVVGFVGCRPGEGATTLALHFAQLMARVVERRVLLVDTDLGQPNLGLSGAVGERSGFCELLRGEARPEDVVLGTEEPRLHFLPAGREQARHIDATASDRVRPVLDGLAGHYDWVVVDMAPVLRRSEARLIGIACTGIVLVVRAHRTPRALAQRALAELTLSRCRVLGSVLNDRKESLPRFLRERV